MIFLGLRLCCSVALSDLCGSSSFEGNGTVKGKWTLKALDAENTRIDLTTSGELEIPLPGLVKFIVAPVVTHEFGRMVDTYVENLSRTLNAPEKKKPASRKKSS